MAGRPLNGKPRRGRGDGTLEQRGPESWRLRVYAGNDPVTGRPRQASKTVKARNRTIALRYLREFAVEVSQREVTKESVTVKDLLGRWLDEFLPGAGKAKSTLDSYRWVTDKHLIPALGNVRLDKLTAYHLDRYYRAQQKAGTADRTVRLHHSIMSSALTQAVKWGWRADNPASRATPPKVPRGMGFIPTIAQIAKMIEAADDDLKTAIRLAAVTGCRRGELAGLLWSDIDWSAGTIRVERQRVRLSTGVATLPLKHGEGRTVSLGPLGVATCINYKVFIEARCSELGVERLDDGWLLSVDGGRTPMHPQEFSHRMAELGKRTGIPVTPHSLRRFAATQLLGEVDVRTAAGRLGHSPEVMLRRYAGFLPSRDEAAGEYLSKVLGGLALPPPT